MKGLFSILGEAALVILVTVPILWVILAVFLLGPFGTGDISLDLLKR